MMKALLFGFMLAAAGLECEVHRQLKKISEAQAEQKEGCNEQNFNIHYLCGLLVATNFRKYLSCLHFLMINLSLNICYLRGPYAQFRISFVRPLSCTQ